MRTARTLSENDIHRMVTDAIFELEAVYHDFRWVHHSPSETKSVGRAVAMKRMACRAGILDFEWCLRKVAVGLDGTRHVLSGLAVELKAGKNGLSPAQRDRARWLEKNGWRVVVCRSAKEALNAFLEYYALDDPE